MISLGKSILKSRAVRDMVTKLEEKLPPLRAWHRFEYDQHFARDSGHERLFAGLYDNCEAALLEVPAGRRVGYNHAEVADRHNAESGRIWPSDYPILFWMNLLLREGVSIFDLGGNIGLHFYAFAKYLRYPPQLSWKVCEVPHVAAQAAELARIKQTPGLTFTTDFADVNGADILLASGVLQFLPELWWLPLSKLRIKPQHLLINRTPLCEGKSFVTLQNLGPVVCAYQIHNRDNFVKELNALGYSLRDYWENPDFSCYIPFHPEHSVKAYTGMYLQLNN